MSKLAKCDTCGWKGPVEETLNPIPDLEERLDPNGPAPVGECPKCRFLAYLIDKSIVEVDGCRSREFLSLGIQTSTTHVYQDAHWKACAWAPNAARSYTILEFYHTDYHGASKPGVTGYATIYVQYYRKVGDGMYPVVPKALLNPWTSGKEPSLGPWESHQGIDG